MAASVSEVGGWCCGSLKTDDTLDVRNAAAAFPAARPLLRRAASSGMNLRAGWDSPPPRALISERVARRRECARAPERMKRSGKGEF